MAVDASLLSITDINTDGIIQLAEISIHKDIVVLPRKLVLPFVISGMVAAYLATPFQHLMAYY